MTFSRHDDDGYGNAKIAGSWPSDPIPGQLSLERLMPKPGSVKSAVLHLLQAHPEGMCRRDFANEDIYELSNRIGELQADGWVILKGRCERHNHRQRFVEYYLP